MNDPIEISYAAHNEAEEILNLQKSAFHEQGVLYNNLNLPPLLETVQDIQDAFSSHSIFKAERNNFIVGSIRAAVIDKTCHVSRLIVAPDHQNKGIGKMLLSHVESIFKNQVDRFELFTGRKSEKNIYIYTKSGYEIYKTDDSYTVPVCYMEKFNKINSF